MNGLQIPPSFRWQEIKDVAKEYCPGHVRSVETIGPDHKIALVLVAGQENADKAFGMYLFPPFRHSA
jgi:hypothetical protein